MSARPKKSMARLPSLPKLLSTDPSALYRARRKFLGLRSLAAPGMDPRAGRQR